MSSARYVPRPPDRIPNTCVYKNWHAMRLIQQLPLWKFSLVPSGPKGVKTLGSMAQLANKRLCQSADRNTGLFRGSFRGSFKDSTPETWTFLAALGHGRRLVSRKLCTVVQPNDRNRSPLQLEVKNKPGNLLCRSHQDPTVWIGLRLILFLCRYAGDTRYC